MARKGCFEVTKLKFTFYSTTDECGKSKLISEGLKRYMKKYASNTSYEVTHKLNELESHDVEVMVEFSKSISVKTINNILSNVIGPKAHQIIYTQPSKEMRVSILG